MNRILIIGGGGYVGSAITNKFLTQGFHLTVLDNFIYNHKFAINKILNQKNYTFQNFDIRFDSINEYDLGPITHVIILSGLVGDPITSKYPKLSNDINIVGIKKIINDLSNDDNLLSVTFVSTCSNYGILPEGEVANEDSPLSPISLYAKAKVEIEDFFQKKEFKCPKFILRFATAFGLSPRMRFDLTLNEFTRNLFFKKYQEVYDYDTWRPYCHLQDFANAFNLIFKNYNKFNFEIFNVGSDENNYTKKMLSELIQSYIPNSVVRYTDASIDKRDYKVSFEKINKLLNFKSEYSVPRGIEEILESLKNGFYIDLEANKSIYGNYKIDKSFYKNI